MEVKLETQCPRCGKKTEKAVPLEVAQELAERQAQAKLAADKFTNDLKNLYNATTGLPDIVTIFRPMQGDDRESPVVWFFKDDLCDAPDAKRNKGCIARVRTLLEEIYFPGTKKAPRKPRAPKVPKEPKEPKKKEKE